MDHVNSIHSRPIPYHINMPTQTLCNRWLDYAIMLCQYVWAIVKC